MDFFQTCKNVSFRQDKFLYGFGDLQPIFKVKGEFSLKICLEPVNGFHLTWDRYIARTSQICDFISFSRWRSLM